MVVFKNFVPGQRSPALGGADDVANVIRRSEEAEEEETEEMDFEEQPSRFQYCLHFFPRAMLAGLVVHFRARVRRAPP